MGLLLPLSQFSILLSKGWNINCQPFLINILLRGSLHHFLLGFVTSHCATWWRFNRRCFWRFEEIKRTSKSSSYGKLIILVFIFIITIYEKENIKSISRKFLKNFMKINFTKKKFKNIREIIFTEKFKKTTAMFMLQSSVKHWKHCLSIIYCNILELRSML